MSVPILILFSLVGALEGLVERDLRRWGGGRESSYLFHHAKRGLAPLLVIPIFVYLTSPFTTPVSWIALPAAIGLGGVHYLLFRSFKKYL